MDAKILKYEALLEKINAEQKEQEKIQKEASELQIAQTKEECSLKIIELMNDLKKEKEKCGEMKFEMEKTEKEKAQAQKKS
uniref:Uncharacterized protein n=1 Tax=Panagrolaimus davidi TaxID=227884 RepID=A0A914NYK9_9BILA